MDFSDLECHFTWQPEINDEEKGLDMVLERSLHSIKHEEELEKFYIPFAAYIYCRTSPTNHDRALSIINDFLMRLEQNHDDCILGYETLSLSNKCFILKEMGRSEDARKILKSIKKIDDLNDAARAAIYGSHAFTLGHFGPSNYHKGLELYVKAKKLDKSNYKWHLGMAFLAGRIRRVEEGCRTQPTEMEEESLRLACELTEWKLAVPIVFLADIILARGRDFTGGSNVDEKALEDAKKFYKMALEVGPDSSTVLKKCGKGFGLLREEQLGKDCLLKSIALDPFSSQTYHRLAQIYEHGKKKDLNFAEKYYAKAVTVGRRRNFFAECDLCRVRKKLDVTYESIKHYEEMKTHYEFDVKKMEMLHKKIADIKEYHENKRKQSQLKKKQAPRRFK